LERSIRQRRIKENLATPVVQPLRHGGRRPVLHHVEANEPPASMLPTNKKWRAIWPLPSQASSFAARPGPHFNVTLHQGLALIREFRSELPTDVVESKATA